ncbi:hypothetical protein M758_5G193600 [Ceratodon purpureus]|nr:hypothetical protein M758_5G193600 [Ceratodon purpureus]
MQVHARVLHEFTALTLPYTSMHHSDLDPSTRALLIANVCYRSENTELIHLRLPEYVDTEIAPDLSNSEGERGGRERETSLREDTDPTVCVVNTARPPHCCRVQTDFY